MFQCPRLLLPSKLKRNFTLKAASNEIVNEATTRQSLIGVYALKHHKQMSPTLCNSQQALFTSSTSLSWSFDINHKQAFQSIFSASNVFLCAKRDTLSVGGSIIKWKSYVIIAAVAVLCTHKGGQISGMAFCASESFSERKKVVINSSFTTPLNLMNQRRPRWIPGHCNDFN